MAEMHGFARWMVNRRTERRARQALAALHDHLALEPSARILELGSGGGGMLALLHERYRPSLLVGTDYDPAQVEVARTFLTARWTSVPPTVDLRRADALNLPFPDGSFDAVFAMMMLHHVEAHHGDYQQRPKAVSEIRRVLRPGGQLVYSEIFSRPELRTTLLQLGFTPRYLKSGWRKDLAIYESARARPASP